MSQITSGLRGIFSSALIYDGFQDLLGANEIRRELANDFIKATAGMRILDVGCGTAGILNHFPPDIEYFGFDVSERYISCAVRRFGARGTFHCGYFDDHQADKFARSIDIVIGLGILHHLDDAEAKSVFRLSHRVLKPSGRTMTMDPVYAEGQGRIAKYLIDKDRGQNVRTSSGYTALPGDYFRHVEGTVRRRSRIPYTEWVMQCRDARADAS